MHFGSSFGRPSEIPIWSSLDSIKNPTTRTTFRRLRSKASKQHLVALVFSFCAHSSLASVSEDRFPFVHPPQIIGAFHPVFSYFRKKCPKKRTAAWRGQKAGKAKMVNALLFEILYLILSGKCSTSQNDNQIFGVTLLILVSS